MALRYKTTGFVFKKTDRNESDKIFSVFTKDFGRVEISGKAIRKINSKLRSGIDIFCLSEIEFIQGKRHKTLTDAGKIKKYGNIGKNFLGLRCACKIAEILDDFIKGQEKDEDIFNLLNETFEKLDNCSLLAAHCKLVYHYFFWNFFSELGYEPQVQKCALCRQKLEPHNIYFSNKEGGVVCQKCALLDKNAIKINSDIVKILRLVLNKNWGVLKRLKVEGKLFELLKSISNNYYLYFLDKYEHK